jgi:hypothetical protein
MAIVRFTGRVLPKHVNLNFTLPDRCWRADELGLDIIFKISIVNSRIYIECEAERYDDAHFVEFYRRAIDLSQTAVSLASFATGLGIFAFIDKFVNQHGVTSSIHFVDPVMSQLCKSYSITPTPTDSFTRIVNAVFSDVNIMFALNDLTEIMRLGHVTTVRCALVMDRIKHIISPDGIFHDSDKWPRMRDNLNIDEGYLKYITDISKNHRHGRPGFIPGAATVEVSRRSWIIMDRFLEYKKRDSSPLPLSEFPLLT